MSELQRIDALIQFTNDSGSEWIDNSILPPNFLVYDSENNVIKKGNGNSTFDELPVWLDLNTLDNIDQLVNEYFHTDILKDENKNKLIIIGVDNKINVIDITKDELKIWIDTIIEFSSGDFNTMPLTTYNITIPIISRPNQYSLGSLFKLIASSYSFFGDTDDLLYKWILPDGSEVQGKEIEYTIPNDETLLNEYLNFSCYAISKYGFRSYNNDFKIQIKGSEINNEPYITNVEMNKIY